MDYKNILVGIGNPLLDITANVDKQFVQNHRLEENGSMLVTKKYMDELIDEILNSQSDPNIEYTPGGTILNTVRIFQWAMNRIVNNDNKPITHFATFFGATGNDDYSEILLSESQKSGLRMLCQKIEDEHTGRCLTMINGTKRSMCADLGAASKFNLEFLETPENWSVIENATVYYTSAHFLNVSPNYEYRAFANEMNFDKIEDIKDIGLEMAKFEKVKLKLNNITDDLPLIVIKNDGQMIEYKVKEIPNGTLVDSSCAGDAFAGG
uniref:Adenosine kinase n=1 Tax=Meloidogyne javanica TaxID=6303 RepID=A0A915LL59_MELJA